METPEASAKHPVTLAVTQVEESHERIRRDLDALGKLADVRDIGAIADDLVDLLKQHFEEEERPDGLFEELATLRPAVEAQVDYLRNEHGEILEALDALRRQVRESAEGRLQPQFEQRADRIQTLAAAFVQLIRHHERIESRLVSETYYTDEGGRG